jgi:hypothetical protein
MKSRILFLSLLCCLAWTAAPVAAGDFSLMGSWWNTDIAGDAGGGGISLGLPVNETFAFEIRGFYYEQLNDDPFEAIFDQDETVFQDRGIQAIPIDGGIRFTFAPGSTFRPYLGAGATYYLLDSDFGEIADELGWYASAGATVGDGEGADFFFEGTWRKVSAQVEIDPEDLEDIDDIDADDDPDFDLDGFGVNVGVRWSF